MKQNGFPFFYYCFLSLLLLLLLLLLLMRLQALPFLFVPSLIIASSFNTHISCLIMIFFLVCFSLNLYVKP
jgi:hypothetical protein